MTTFADHLRSTATAATDPPAGHEATCPECGGASNATIIRGQGKCLKCMMAAFQSRA
jgi:hypothetical protein